MSDITLGENSPMQFPEPQPDGISYGGARATFRTAALAMGVELMPQEDHDWLAVLGAGMLIDHLVDDEKIDINEPFANMMAGELREDLDYAVQVRTVNYWHRQTPERQIALSGMVSRVNELIPLQRQTTSARGVVDIRIEEADIFAATLALPIRNDAPDAAARAKFNRWQQGFGRVGYLLDSLFDVREDYDNGESAVRPTTAARLIIGASVAKESAKALAKTPPAVLGNCVLAGFNYVVRKRRLEVRNDV